MNCPCATCWINLSGPHVIQSTRSGACLGRAYYFNGQRDGHVLAESRMQRNSHDVTDTEVTQEVLVGSPVPVGRVLGPERYKFRT